MKNLSKMITAQIKACIKHQSLQSLFVPADPRIWEMFAFATGKKVAKGEFVTLKAKPSITIEEIETREVSEADPSDSEKTLIIA